MNIPMVGGPLATHVCEPSSAGPTHSVHRLQFMSLMGTPSRVVDILVTTPAIQSRA